MFRQKINNSILKRSLQARRCMFHTQPPKQPPSSKRLIRNKPGVRDSSSTTCATTNTTTTTARQALQDKWIGGMPVLSKEAFRDALPIIGNGAYLVRAIFCSGNESCKTTTPNSFRHKTTLSNSFFRFSTVLTFFYFPQSSRN